jgi:hypothetical protein
MRPLNKLEDIPLISAYRFAWCSWKWPGRYGKHRLGCASPPTSAPCITGRLDDELGSFWYIRGRPSEGHMAIHIALQKFIGTFSAGAAAWPLVPCAQPQSGCGGLMCSL